KRASTCPIAVLASSHFDSGSGACALFCKLSWSTPAKGIVEPPSNVFRVGRFPLNAVADCLKLPSETSRVSLSEISVRPRGEQAQHRIEWRGARVGGLQANLREIRIAQGERRGKRPVGAKWRRQERRRGIAKAAQKLATIEDGGFFLTAPHAKLAS